MRREMARPRPPGASGFVEKKGSKTRSRSAARNARAPVLDAELHLVAHGAEHEAHAAAARRRVERVQHEVQHHLAERVGRERRSERRVRGVEREGDAEVRRAVGDELGDGRARGGERRAVRLARGRRRPPVGEHQVEQALDPAELLRGELVEALAELGLGGALGEELEERLHRHQRVSDLVDDLGDELAQGGEPVEPAHFDVEAREALLRGRRGERGSEALGRRAEGGERAGTDGAAGLSAVAEEEHGQGLARRPAHRRGRGEAARPRAGREPARPRAEVARPVERSEGGEFVVRRLRDLALAGERDGDAVGAARPGGGALAAELAAESVQRVREEALGVAPGRSPGALSRAREEAAPGSCLPPPRVAGAPWRPSSTRSRCYPASAPRVNRNT